MSGSINIENYGVLLVWLVICTLYTVLLAATALSVAFLWRKRRSPILKFHRPPELEFNVAAPTDSAKSKHVSFSYRTGKAEFVTNEETTTWKNFCEEHNKTAEPLGNEYEMNPTGSTIGHLDSSPVDQCFQGVKAVDLISTSWTRGHFKTSINNINISQQSASLECFDDRKLTTPHQNFEISSVTNNQSKIFDDDLDVTGMEEITNTINLSFLAVQPIRISKNDDLDAIQREIRNVQSQGLPETTISPGPGPFGQPVSEYVEMRNEESDMSIIDTVHNSKVQYVSKSNPSLAVENMYIACKETSNVDINEACDNFFKCDRELLREKEEKESESTNHVTSHFTLEKNIQRENIALNQNNDLPNIIDDPCSSMLKGTSHYFMTSKNDGQNDLSMIQDVNDNLEINTNKRKRIIYKSYDVDISVTEEIPSNTILDEKAMSPYCKTLSGSQSDKISLQPVPKTILSQSQSMPTRRNTILYEDNAGQIYLTEDLPSNSIIEKENEKEDFSGKRKTIVLETNSADISITQAIPSNLVLTKKSSIALGKKKTTVFEDEAGNISITQSVPANLIFSKRGNISHKERTVVYGTDMGDISLTQTFPSDFILPQKCTSMPDSRKTVIYEDNDGNISIKQAVVSNVMMSHTNSSPDKIRTVIFESNNGNISITQSVGSNFIPDIKNDKNCKIDSQIKKESVIFEKEISEHDESHKIVKETNAAKERVEKAKSVLIKSDSQKPCSIQSSIFKKEPLTIETDSTLAKGNIMLSHKDSSLDIMRTVIFKSDNSNISILQSVGSNFILNINNDENCEIESQTKAESVIFEKGVSQHDESYKNDKEKNAVNERIKKVKSVLIESDYQNPCSTRSSSVKKDPLTIDTDSIIAKGNIINHTTLDYTLQCATSTSFSMEPKEEFHDVDVSMSEAGDVCKQKDRSKNESPSSYEKFSEALIKKRLKKTTIAFENDSEIRPVKKPIPSYFTLSELEESKNAVKVSQYMPHNIVVYKADTDIAHSPQTIDSVSEATPITRSYENIQLSESLNKIVYKADTDIAHSPQTIDSVSEATPITRSYENIQLSESLNKITPKESYIKHKQNVTFKEESETKKSILDDLLDMSNVDMADGFDDKNIMALIESGNPSEILTSQKEDALLQVKKDKSVDRESPMEQVKSVDYSASKESLFYITKDSPINIRKNEETKHEEIISGGKDSVKNNESYDLIKGIQKKLKRFKEQIDDDCFLNGRVEAVINADSVTDNKAIEQIPKPVYPNVITKQTRPANDTKNLLDLISEFTDREEENHPVTEVQSRTEVTVGEGALTTEDISNVAEGQVGLLPKQPSTVLSREDLINNISMAPVVPQKLRAEIEVSEVVIDDTETVSTASTDQIDRTTQSKKMVQLSNEVLRKLHFEEDLIFSKVMYDNSEFQRGVSPVKKTAFGEESYMRDNKANVIPTYLKDVSDGIKQLMSDLVKPTADTLPFETVRVDKGVHKAPSTASLQVQANLLASSQVDLTESELTPKICRSSFSNDKEESVKKIVQFIPEKQINEPKGAYVIPPPLPARPITRRRETDRVLVFDHNNPLNNVLLAPFDFSEVHSYNPVRSEEVVNETSEQAAPESIDDKESDEHICIHRITIERECYAVNDVKTTSVAMQCDAQESDSESECKSVPESVSVKKSVSRDNNSGSPTSNSMSQSLNQSIGALVVEMKDTEVNTAIVMRSTEELLQYSSSLTLVDDTVSRGNARLMCKMDEREEDKELENTESKHASTKRARKFSPVQAKQLDQSKGYKRVNNLRHKNNKYCTLESLEVTPKPACKIQKINYIPPTRRSGRQSRARERYYESTTSQSESGRESRSGSRSPNSRKQSPKKFTLGPKEQGVKVPAVTVQRVKTKYNIDCEPINVEVFKKSHLTDVSEESDVVSKAHGSERAHSASAVSLSESTRSNRSEGLRSQAYSMEWQPELLNELSSKNLVAECESGINVVAKIDNLPFMGSGECQWKSASSDTWVFKLMHGRLRLSVRLAHRPNNPACTLVPADTPVVHVHLDRPHHENKNPVAMLCVRFAKEAMRHVIRRGIACAGEVPALLRACASVARVALQWGDAMYDTYQRLALSLSEDGRLELKVANIPLRSVWEVSMRVAMVAVEGRELPCPCASDVDVTAVLSDYPVSPQETARALHGLRRDWGHVPLTVWRIFKYLKSKSCDEDLLLFNRDVKCLSEIK